MIRRRRREGDRIWAAPVGAVEGKFWMGWGLRIEWDQPVDDLDSIATAVLEGHVRPGFACGEDDRTNVYRISTTAHDLLSQGAAELLAHQLAAEIRDKVNEHRGESGPALSEPRISVFEEVPTSPLDDEPVVAEAAPQRWMGFIRAAALVVGIVAALLLLAVRFGLLH